jgi:putative transposase
MTTRKHKAKFLAVEAVAGDRDLMKALMKEALQEVLEGEMTDCLGAAPGERTEGRTGDRAGDDSRNLITRIGKLELRVPRDRNGEFSTALFERYARSEKALVAALAEMVVQGVSTRKVKAITEELCGHSFSASTMSSINKRLDAALERFANRRLEEDYPYLMPDADLLPATAGPPQAHEEHEHARAAQRGDRAPHPGRAHLPQYGCLSAADPCPVRRNPGGLAGG